MRGTRIGTLVLALVLSTLALLVMAAEAQTPDQGVRVRGEGIVAATPDIATVTLTIATVRPTSPAAFARAAELSEALVRIATEGGVEARDLRTANISLNPEYTVRDNERILTGWRATRTFSIRIRDFARVGPILEQAVNLLGSEGTIQGISYAIEDTDALVSQARAAAFANARAAAEELARLAGMRLGEAISIEEVSATAPTPIQAGASPTPRPSATAAPMLAAAPPNQVQPGQQSVRVTLVIVFSLVRLAPVE